MSIPDSRLTNVVPLHRGELPDAALVVAAREGEQWACEALFRRHVKRAMGLAYRLIPEDDPEDLVQEAFIKVLGQLRQLERPGSFGPWLLAVVVSMVRMRLRKRRWLSRLGLLDDEPVEPDSLLTHTAPPDMKLEVAELYGQLSCLSDDQRIALLLHRVEGLELSEVAERMGVSVSSVKRRVLEAGVILAKVADDE